MDTLSIYEVAYLARRVGAQGIFYPVTRRVMASTEQDAADEAFRVLHLDGYETVHPQKIVKTDETVSVPSI